MTSRLDEETLNAYCDGALDAEARAEVEALLRADAEARELLAKLRRANALAIEAFGEPIQGPQPQALVDFILQDHSPRSDRAVPTWVGGLAMGMRTYAVPLAASLALIAGIATGLLLGRPSGQAPAELALGAVPLESQLHRLLESIPSGRILEIDGPPGSTRRHAVVATFMDRYARPCREVEVLPPDTDQPPLAAAVACRSSDGGWTVEGAVKLAMSPSANDRQFEPSGVAEKDALEGLLNMLGAQAALSPEEEQALVQRGWR
jgi:anti-sigma factor RsiW